MLLSPTLVSSSLLCQLSLVSALAARPAQDLPQRPNILWLTVEDMSPWLPCYGDTTVPTPNLDRLAAQSVRYTNAFASSPVCAPARSSLITGMYATRMGTMQMRTGNPSQASLARRSRCLCGDTERTKACRRRSCAASPSTCAAQGYYCTNNRKKDYQFVEPQTVWDRSNAKAHWRERPDGAPFFAVFNHTGTHESQAFPNARRRPAAVQAEDVQVPPLYPDTPAVRDALARTYNNIAAMDVWVGRHLDALEGAGLADSTVVFFFSDHGVGLPRGKRSPYDLGTRVPLLVRFPGLERAGTNDQRVVSFIDFAPTVLSLAGLAPDRRLDGVPFLGAHQREGNGFTFTHADRFDAVYDRTRSVSDGRFRLVRNYERSIPYLLPNAYRRRLAMTADLEAMQRGEREAGAGQWQLAASERPAEELYDSVRDPWEIVNRVDEPALAATRIRLAAALDAWIEQTGDLGLVVSEQQMVRDSLWPDLTQPTTAEPRVKREAGLLTIECDTPGASLGYRRVGDSAWSVYTAPVQSGFEEGETIEVLAHRIGFAPATVRVP